MTTIPDEERVRREVEEIAARPSAQRELLAELLVTLRRLSADVAAIRRDLRALALATTEGGLRECATCGELERGGQLLDGERCEECRRLGRQPY